MELKAKKSYRTTVLAMVILPLVVLAASLLGVSYFKLKSSNAEQVEEKISYVTRNYYNLLDERYPGDLSVNADDKLCKGDAVVSDDGCVLADEVKALTDDTIEVTIFYGDTRYITTILKEDGSRLIGTQASEAVIEAVLKGGNTYFADDVIINGAEYYAYYEPIKGSNGDIVGMMFAGLKTEKVSSYLLSNVLVVVIISLAILVLGIVVAFITAGKLVKILKGLSNGLVTMSQGVLNEEVDAAILKRTDEFGVMAQATEKLRAEFQGVVGGLIDNASSLKNSATELDQLTETSAKSTGDVNEAMDNLAAAAMSQAEDTQSANAEMLKIGDMISGITDSVKALNISAKKMDKAEVEADAIIKDVDAGIDKTMEAVERIAKQAETTNESAKKIVNAVSLITSIAEETSLLSLNASIEAARAGEQGRGFSVVADQISTLADQSSVSAQTIEEIIAVLVADSNKTVEIMEEVKEIVSDQQRMIKQTQEKFGVVGEGVKTSVENIGSIENQVEKLDEAKKAMASIILNLSAISEENAASAEETTVIISDLKTAFEMLSMEAKGLNGMSGDLSENMNHFTV